MTKNNILEVLAQEKEYLQDTYEIDKIGLNVRRLKFLV